MVIGKMKPGTKPKGVVRIEWSADFAYAIGLIASDGSLSKDGRHVVFTSKDDEQIVNFCCALNILVSVGKTYSRHKNVSAYRVQIGDVLFYEFLISIGLMPNKSKIINKIDIPDIFFLDFLRGCFDGDGTVYSYWDKRWKSSFMFYTAFCSGSETFLLWLRHEIFVRVGIQGHMTKSPKTSIFQLKYAKEDSLVLSDAMYGQGGRCLSRKRLKIDRILCIIGQSIKSVGQ